MPYYVGRVVDSEQSLVARTPEAFRKKQNIDVRIRHEVEAVDLAGRRVSGRDLESGAVFEKPFDTLLIATGASPMVPDIPGVRSRNVFTLSSLEGGVELRRFVDENAPKRAVIVGGGYIGLEMAEALLGRGIETALIEREAEVMGTLDPDMGSLVSGAVEEAGVALYRKESLTGFEVGGDAVRAVVTDQRTLPVDMVILGLGVRPASGLARDAGIPLGEKGSIRVNDRMQTPVEGVWAAGDCAESFHLVSRRPFWVALGTVANKHGRVAGMNLSGGDEIFPGVVGTAVTKMKDTEVARTGLMEREIRALGLDFVQARIDDRTRAGYYPGSAKITVKLLAEKGSGRLLGGQIVGGEGSAKRIDVIAAALHAGFSAGQLLYLDLGYAPPFSPVWDPVLTAARVLVSSF